MFPCFCRKKPRAEIAQHIFFFSNVMELILKTKVLRYLHEENKLRELLLTQC